MSEYLMERKHFIIFQMDHVLLKKYIIDDLKISIFNTFETFLMCQKNFLGVFLISHFNSPNKCMSIFFSEYLMEIKSLEHNL